MEDRPICGPLGSRDLIPVVESTRNRQVGNQWVAEDHRKSGAPNSDRHRLSPGEAPSFEQNVRQLKGFASVGSFPRCAQAVFRINGNGTA